MSINECMIAFNNATLKVPPEKCAHRNGQTIVKALLFHFFILHYQYILSIHILLQRGMLKNICLSNIKIYSLFMELTSSVAIIKCLHVAFIAKELIKLTIGSTNVFLSFAVIIITINIFIDKWIRH